MERTLLRKQRGAQVCIANLAKASAKHLDTTINRSNLRVLKKKGLRKNSEKFFRDTVFPPNPKIFIPWNWVYLYITSTRQDLNQGFLAEFYTIKKTWFSRPKSSLFQLSFTYHVCLFGGASRRHLFLTSTRDNLKLFLTIIFYKILTFGKYKNKIILVSKNKKN